MNSFARHYIDFLHVDSLPVVNCTLRFFGRLILCCGALSQSVSALANDEQPSHLRLVDRLDRPEDGYCLDVHGPSPNLRTDLPLFAHNCKPRLTSDSAVVFDSEGRLRFSALSLCVTVAGVNSNALPGASVLLRKCGENTLFFETAKLQRFTHREDGQFELTGSNLCLAVGIRSATTYSAADTWRPLFVDDCTSVEPARSRWEFAIPAL